jgi:ubiquinone/menaquinone biosynthesis C-methylase UbiE
MKMSLAERFRAQFQEPFAAMKQAGIREGLTIVDLGAGHGYFTVPAAIIVGATGLVYSIEPDPARSQRIRERIASEGLHNVRVITTEAEQLSGIPSDSVDLAFSAFTLHHFHDVSAALTEVRRILRKGGVFYVWDRVPGAIVRHGTKPEELNGLAPGFSGFELLSAGRTAKARYTK